MCWCDGDVDVLVEALLTDRAFWLCLSLSAFCVVPVPVADPFTGDAMEAAVVAEQSLVPVPLFLWSMGVDRDKSDTEDVTTQPSLPVGVLGVVNGGKARVVLDMAC